MRKDQNLLIKKLSSKRGASTIIHALIIAALIMMAAFVIDFGVGSVVDAQIQNAVDASALAGGLYLKESEEMARSKADEIALLNGLDPGEYEIIIDMDEMTVEVKAIKTFNTGLARVFNINSADAHASSKVKVAPAGRIGGGIKPLAIEEQYLEYGQTLDLKLNAQDNINGNFGALSLGATGAAAYEDNLINGYDGSIAIGDVIDTNPGNMTSVINPVRNLINSDSATFDNYTRESERIWIVPVVDSMDVNGASPVTVVGFALFFIEDVGKQSGQTTLTGRFIEYTTLGSFDDGAGDFGLDAVSIIE